jgi:SAM-dependent methyltransferase
LLYEGLQDHLFGVPGTWNFNRCSSRQCGLVWLDPMPIEEDIARLYETYSTHASGSSFLQSDTSAFRRKIGRALLANGFGYIQEAPNDWTDIVGRLGIKSRFFRARVGSNVSWLDASWCGRLIDVGCGNGEFLVRMRELGWDVTGVEPDPHAAKIAREKYGLPIVLGSLADSDFAPESFDAITMNQVIEHLMDPVSTLKIAKKLLTKNGHLVIQTPNVCSLGHRWFRDRWRGLEPPRHLFLFSLRTLCKTVALAGFKSLNFENNSIASDYMWKASSAGRAGLDPNSCSTEYCNISRRLFMLLEHLVTGWPFCCAWGEQLAMIVVKE